MNAPQLQMLYTLLHTPTCFQRGKSRISNSRNVNKLLWPLYN